MPKKPKIIIAMSGGVDSSVSAALLKEQGFEVAGVFMKVWSDPTSPMLRGASCPWVEDQFEARRAAEHIGIPFYTVNLEKAYKKAVVDYFFAEYKAGRTPNPDVLCNSEIKFGVFLKQMLAMGADFIATGHYARLGLVDRLGHSSQYSREVRVKAGDNKIALTTPINHTGSQTVTHQHMNILKRGLDPKKDQSYFLWRLTQDQLKYVVFPVGHLKKSQVRELAKKFKLPNADRKDSQGICFIGEVDVVEFLKTKLSVKQGKVITRDGQIVGVHDGVWFYTIGQRHGWEPTSNFTLGKSGSEPILSPSSDGSGSARSTDLPPADGGGTMPDRSVRASSPRQNLAYHADRPPLYVTDKDLKNNTLIVGPADDPKLWANGMVVSNINWIMSKDVVKGLGLSSQPLATPLNHTGSQTQTRQPIRIQCQIRYQQQPISCEIKYSVAGKLEVTFSEPIRAVTPGQSAVFLDGEVVVGGGVIERAIF